MSLLLELPLQSPNHKIQAGFGSQKKRGGQGHGPRRSKRGQWKLGRESDSLLDRVLAFCKQRNMQNTLFYEEICGKNHASHIHLTYKLRFRSLSEQIILLKKFLLVLAI